MKPAPDNENPIELFDCIKLEKNIQKKKLNVSFDIDRSYQNFNYLPYFKVP